MILNWCFFFKQWIKNDFFLFLMEHFTKMATTYDVGELVSYRNQICLISEVRPTQGGYNTYFLEDIDEDRMYVAFKHQLEKAIHLDIVTLDDIDDVVITQPMVGPQQPGASQSTSEAAITPSTNLETLTVPSCPLSPRPSTSTGVATVPTPTVKGKSRFPTLTATDVDELASSRTSKNTNEQTKWGVKLFRGEWKSTASIGLINVNHSYLIKSGEVSSKHPTRSGKTP